MLVAILILLAAIAACLCTLLWSLSLRDRQVYVQPETPTITNLPRAVAVPTAWRRRNNL